MPKRAMNLKRSSNARVGKSGKRRNMSARRQGLVPQARRVSNKVPRMNNIRNGVTIAHKERVPYVFSSEYPAFADYYINPSNSKLFRWLSGIAPNFESYVFQKLEISFVTTTPTTEPGGLTVAIDYDPKDDAPIDAAALESYQGAISFPVYTSATLRANKAGLTKRKTYYTRSTTTVDDPDRLTDVGRLFIALEGVATNTPGRLYVDYVVRLLTPQSVTPNNLVTNIYTDANLASNPATQQDGVVGGVNQLTHTVGSLLTQSNGLKPGITAAALKMLSANSNFTGSLQENVIDIAKAGKYLIQGEQAIELSKEDGTTPVKTISQVEKLLRPSIFSLEPDTTAHFRAGTSGQAFESTTNLGNKRQGMIIYQKVLDVLKPGKIALRAAMDSVRDDAQDEHLKPVAGGTHSITRVGDASETDPFLVAKETATRLLGAVV